MVIHEQNSSHTAPPRAFLDTDARKFLKRGYDALNAGRFDEAGNCCVLVLKYRPKEVGAHFLMGLVSSEMAKWPMARQAFKNVITIDESHVAGWAQLARCFVLLGQYANAEKALEKAVALNPADPLVQDVMGTVFSLLGDQATALEWYEKACETSKNPLFDLSRAKGYTFMGRIAEAEDALESVLRVKPDTAQAHWMLSRVRKAEDDTHIGVMRGLAEKLPPKSPSHPFLWYAIGKEYEDLEEWDAAFEAYEKGATARRVEVRFDEEAEIQAFEALKSHFTKDWFASVAKGSDDNSPIFVIGQPRTGTTLIERIMTAHSDVHSAGELQQFGLAVKRVGNINASGPITAEGVPLAAQVDPQKLAELYLATSKSMLGDTPRFVDKMPVNYMYAPLIAAAFPKGKIVHVTRNPMDSCVASYKQLFADAYYHSYDQGEMARHHARYRDLMDHWRDVLGDCILDISYEDVVTDLRPQAERLISFLDLDWQEACVNFHEQSAAVTTASAVQVREKAHTRSVGRWKQFEEQLLPMKGALLEAGIKVN